MLNLIEGLPSCQQRLQVGISCLSGHIEGSFPDLYGNIENNNMCVFKNCK